MDKGICSKERTRKNNLRKGLNETEVSNSPGKEFKIMVTRCLLNLEEWRNIVSTSMKRQKAKKENQSDLTCNRSTSHHLDIKKLNKGSDQASGLN